MSFPQHTTSKGSGTSLLGDIPEHWNVISLKVLVQPARRITYGIVQAGADTEGGIPYIRPTDMTDEDGVEDAAALLKTTAEIASAYSRSTIREGDLVCSIGPSFGKVMATPKRLDGANLTQGTARVAIDEMHSSRFVFWALRSLNSQAQWEISVGGATFRALNLEPLERTKLAVPTIVEQMAIAAFLDRETAKIDALVEEQKRLIELLKEKRQAVISQAVTKGLDPTVPMKDSGVEWLGQVPAHWEVRSLRRLLLRIEQGWSPDCFARPADGDEWGVLKTGCLNGGAYRSEENKALPNALSPRPEIEVKVGDILMSRASGSPALVGSIALVGRTRDRLMLSDKLFRLHLLSDVASEWFVLAMGSRLMRTQIENALNGGNGMANNLPQASLVSFIVPVPPKHEQIAIASHIALKASECAALSVEANKAVSLLAERRSALISAAVTGKIDVRTLIFQPAMAFA